MKRSALIWTAPASQKLVPFLQNRLGGGYSGKALRRALEANLCRVNGKVERFGSASLSQGDQVELASRWQEFLSSSQAPCTVVYEDEFLKIVDKPVDWVCDERQAAQQFGASVFLVHRLDKDTTGLLILAKNSQARDAMRALFEERKIQKSYLALVDGIPRETAGVRQSLLAKKGSFQGQTIWGSGAQGLTAVTRWELKARGDRASLLLCEPETGRTHQIRVHLAEMGHPILVDRQYASSFRSPLFIRRPLLHASRLRFEHPCLNLQIDVSAPLPSDFREALLQAGITLNGNPDR